MKFAIIASVLSTLFALSADGRALIRRAEEEIFLLVDCVARSDYIIDGKPSAPDYHYSEVAYFLVKPSNASSTPTAACQLSSNQTSKGWDSSPVSCNFTDVKTLFTADLYENATGLATAADAGTATWGDEEFNCFRDLNTTRYYRFNTVCSGHFYCTPVSLAF